MVQTSNRRRGREGTFHVFIDIKLDFPYAHINKLRTIATIYFQSPCGQYSKRSGAIRVCLKIGNPLWGQVERVTQGTKENPVFFWAPCFQKHPFTPVHPIAPSVYNQHAWTGLVCLVATSPFFSLLSEKPNIPGKARVLKRRTVEKNMNKESPRCIRV